MYSARQNVCRLCMYASTLVADSFIPNVRIGRHLCWVDAVTSIYMQRYRICMKNDDIFWMMGWQSQHDSQWDSYVGRLAVAALYEDTHKYDWSTTPVKWFQTSSMAVIPSSLEGILQGCRPTADHSQTSCLKPSFRSQTIKAHLQTSKNIQA